jgi:phage shock protein C
MSAKKSNHPYRNNSIIGGVVLVVLGLVFLIQSFLHIDILDKLWPLILVAVGIGIIFNARRK